MGKEHSSSNNRSNPRAKRRSNPRAKRRSNPRAKRRTSLRGISLLAGVVTISDAIDFIKKFVVQNTLLLKEIFEDSALLLSFPLKEENDKIIQQHISLLVIKLFEEYDTTPFLLSSIECKEAFKRKIKSQYEKIITEQSIIYERSQLLLGVRVYNHLLKGHCLDLSPDELKVAKYCALMDLLKDHPNMFRIGNPLILHSSYKDIMERVLEEFKIRLKK
jgi:hypothetical protein